MIHHGHNAGLPTKALTKSDYVVLEAKLHGFIKRLGDKLSERIEEERNETGKIAFSHKMDKSFSRQTVTKYDLISQRVISAELTRLTPGIAIISEEDNKSKRDEKRNKLASGDPYWTVDPIDGTNWMIDGKNNWAILVSLIQDGVPVIGIAYFPELKKCYYTKNGHAFLETPNETRQLHVSNRIGEQLRLHYRSLFDQEDEYYTQSAHFKSANDFAKNSPVQSELSLATGEVDIHRGGTFWSSPKEWDIAPLAAIVRAAGGEIYCRADQHVLKPFRFSNYDVPPIPLYWAHPKVMKALKLIPQNASNIPITAHGRER